MAIIAKLSLNSDEAVEFVVATTHLLYNPRRQDVRLAQIQILFAELDRVAKSSKGNYLPIILTGDFNLPPQSAPYTLITKGELKFDHLTNRTLVSNKSQHSSNGRKLLPIKLGITDQCQHLNTNGNAVRNETKVNRN